MANIFTRATLC